MADRCQLCQRPVDVCGASPDGDIQLVLACREIELANTQAAHAATKAQLDRALLLLIKSRDALDLAIGALQLRGQDAAIEELVEQIKGPPHA